MQSLSQISKPFQDKFLGKSLVLIFESLWLYELHHLKKIFFQTVVLWFSCLADWSASKWGKKIFWKWVWLTVNFF